jgi:hypothetical protein
MASKVKYMKYARQQAQPMHYKYHIMTHTHLILQLQWCVVHYYYNELIGESISTTNQISMIIIKMEEGWW